MARSPKKPNAESPVPVGTVVANTYRVERVLGIGGMGVVVEATHVDLEEPRALKFMLPTVSKDAEGVARFFREARATARLKSEHVAHIFDLGRLEDDTPFLVMEYLDGRDLGSILGDEVRLPIADAVDYAMQALAALAEAHAMGIVHRDLKPANLFVTTGTDGLPLVKIVDFGVSKLLGRQSGAADLTLARAVVGSPHYMSPEQLASARLVDWRTDLWSIGVILYEMLTGRQPFEGSSLTAVTIEVVQASPDPPSSIRAGVTAELDAVVMKCLAKKPEERYRHAADIAADLAPFGPTRARALAEHIARVHEVARASERAVAPELGELDWNRVLEGEAEEPQGARESAASEAPQSKAEPSTSEGRAPSKSTPDTGKGTPTAPPRPNRVPSRALVSAGATPDKADAVSPDKADAVSPDKADAVPPGEADDVPPGEIGGSDPAQGERAGPERDAPPLAAQVAPDDAAEVGKGAGDGTLDAGPGTDELEPSGAASVEGPLPPGSTRESSELVDLSADRQDDEPDAEPQGKRRLVVAVVAAVVVLAVVALVWPRSAAAPDADAVQPAAERSQSVSTTSESAPPDASAAPTTEPLTPDAGEQRQDAATPDAAAPVNRRPPQRPIGRGKLPDIYDD